MAKVDEQVKQFMDVRTLVLTAIISALGFVVALFWRDVVVAFIEEIVPHGEGLFYKFLAAVIVTIIVVVIAYIIVHSQKMMQDTFKQKEEQLKRREEKIKKKEAKTRKKRR